MTDLLAASKASADSDAHPQGGRRLGILSLLCGVFSLVLLGAHWVWPGYHWALALCPGAIATLLGLAARSEAKAQFASPAFASIGIACGTLTLAILTLAPASLLVDLVSSPEGRLRLGYHLQLTLLAVGLGMLISLPLAVLVTRIKSLQGPVLGLASVVQTVPSLALLALMVPLLSRIGFVPALIALVLYSVLPILRNTVTGIAGVDPALVEAARGMGMTKTQMLFRIQFPLAAPVIIAGIRTGTIWVVSIATLCTPVGQKSLGDYIFQGLQTQNQMMLFTGVVAAATLAILLDLLIRAIELAARRRSGRLAIAPALGLALIMAFAAVPLLPARAKAAAGPRIRVGAKTFTEQFILAHLLANQIENAGLTAQQSSGMGSTILFDALAQDNIGCYVDYSGTLWATIMKRTDTPGAQEVLEGITRYLKDDRNITCLGKLGFENTYALAMRRRRAGELGITTIADLARHAPQLRIGGDYEFFGRPEWKKVTDTYGLSFQDTVALDSALMYSAVKEDQIDVICAFSTDGRIIAYDLIVLEDPRQAFPPYDAVLLLSPQASQNRELVKALMPLVGSISSQVMRESNKSVDLDGLLPGEAASNLAQLLAK